MLERPLFAKQYYFRKPQPCMWPGGYGSCDTMVYFAACTIKTRTVYPKKYAHGYCFAVLCCGYTLTDFPISIRLTSLALWQSIDCPSASRATLMNMDIYFMWIHYELLHNHNKAKHNKTVYIFLGIYCMPFRVLLKENHIAVEFHQLMHSAKKCTAGIMHRYMQSAWISYEIRANGTTVE